MIQVKDKNFEPYISANDISDEIARIVREIEENHSDDIPVFLGVLNGSFMFISDLLKEYNQPCEVAFIKAASYQGMESTGMVKFHEAGTLDLKGKSVIVVEDIVDTGNTLNELFIHLKRHEPKSISVCSLLFKKEAYRHNHPIDYVCFEVKNKFLLGYGLDYDGIGRNLPEVYILKEHD